MALDRRMFLGTSLAGAGAATLSSGLAPAAPSATTATRVAITANPIAQTRSGKVRGTRMDNIESYLGIPYGATTGGPNRFRPPQPVQPWDGVRNALIFGPAIPFASPSLYDGNEDTENRYLLYFGWMPHDFSEDCLRLNIWAPSDGGRRKGSRPVMIYMHGGGLAAGSGHDLPAYMGHNLAQRGDVVVVTHNHRLNLFGYLDLSSFGGRWAEASNLGLLDMVAMLKWVRDNIAEFGGDPNNVTIFGQSGGGMKVSALMAMPAARGLFHKAIVQSGSPGIMPAQSPDEARRNTEGVLKELDVGPKDLDKLLTLPTIDLVKANRNRGLNWRYTVGVPSLPVEPGSASADAQTVPLMVGTNLNEFMTAVGNPAAATFTADDLQREAVKAFGEVGTKAVAAYRKEYPTSPPFEIWGAMNVARIRDQALIQTANNFAVTGRSWHYLFSWRTPVLDGRPGTFHSAEIAFVFNNADLCVNQTGGGPDAIALAHRMSAAWVGFARTGNPNHSGLPDWPRFGAERNIMVFDNVCRIRKDPEAEGRALLRGPMANRPLF